MAENYPPHIFHNVHVTFEIGMCSWNRPKLEIDFLMQLLLLSLKDELKNLNKNNIKFKTIGNLERLPKKISDYLLKVKEEINEHINLS